MAFGIPIDVGPAVSLPGIFGVEVIYPVWIVGAVVVLVCSWATVTMAVDWIWLRYHRLVGQMGSNRPRPSPYPGPPPERYTTASLMATLETERDYWRRQLPVPVRTMLARPIRDLMTYYGLPLLVAVTLTGRGSLLWLLLGGHAIRAVRHRRYASRPWWPVVGTFLIGLPEVYLWLLGLWWVAILLHFGELAVAVLLWAASHWHRRRKLAFQPGEELGVTITHSVDRPMKHGCYGTTIAPGRDLYVTDLEPGENARVRVAYSGRADGFAFPIE